MNYAIGNYIDNHLSEMVSVLSRLVSVPSVREEPAPDAPYGKPCARVLDTMLDIAKDFGFTVENQGNRVGTIDLYPAIPPTLGVLCHLDVVPAGDGWKTPPYTLYMNDGKLFGRGASDDKGPAVCVLYALKAIRECKIPLSKNVRFIVGTDEENGSSDLSWYKSKFKLPPYVFTPDARYPVINIEKGMIRGAISTKCQSASGKTILSASGGTVINAVPDKATATVRGFSSDELSAAAKSTSDPDMFSFKAAGDETVCTVTGKSAHASGPSGGKNAVTALCDMLGKLHSDDDTSAMFASLSSLFPFGEYDGTSLEIKCSDRKSGSLTEVLSILDFSDGTLTGKFDMRFPLCSSCVEIKQTLSSLFASKGFDLSEFNGVEPHETDSESPFVRALLSVFTNATGIKGECIAIGGGTYVHDVEGGVAFGAEFSDEDNHIHSANEYIRLSRFALNAKIIAEAILKICK